MWIEYDQCKHNQSLILETCPGFGLFAQRLVWGFLAGLFAGALTVPVDNISTVVMTEVQDAKDTPRWDQIFKGWV